MAEDSDQIKKQVKSHYLIGGVLLGLAAVTVGISQIPFATGAHIVIGLAISLAMAGLVSYFFMHLATEKKLIFQVLTFTVIFFFVLMFLTLLAYHDEVGHIVSH